MDNASSSSALRPAFKFNVATNEWQPAPPAKVDLQSTITPTTPFRIATLNVLADCFPWAVEVMICSPERVAALLQAIEKLDATVLGLNEVTGNILSHLLASPFIRAHYSISHIDTAKGRSNPVLGQHGCVLLSKMPVLGMTLLDVAPNGMGRASSRRVVAAVFQSSRNDGETFAIASQHTQAYQSEENLKLRRLQIRNAAVAVSDLLRKVQGLPTVEGGDHQQQQPQPFVLMGDLNMHYICEDGIILENKLCDLWAETRHNADSGMIEEGFTYDSKTNGLIPRYVPGENRRMRLDRILCSPTFLSLFEVATTATRCELWANECINTALKLHISDHYGLVIDMKVVTPSGDKERTQREAFYQDNSRPVRLAMQANADLPRNKSTFTKWHFGAAMPGQVVAMAKRALFGW